MFVVLFEEMVDYPDILNYSRDELIDEFCKLFDRYQELRESSEADTQKIHELKRSLDTAIAAQAYLSQELEQYINADQTADENELQRTVCDLAELKKKYGKLEEAFIALQQDYNALLDENSALTQSLEEAAKRKQPSLVDIHQSSEEELQCMHMLEQQNLEMLEKIEEFEERTVHHTLAIGEYEKNIEILRDQIICLEENLHSKKEELEEKIQILESTQEQLSEANAKIAMLSSAPEADDRKGNSLFAEVDDQRQAMRKLLTAQKQNYIQMKKIYSESEHEIRRLKRENIAMHTELEACSSIFCAADKVYQDKLNERIRHLSNQNEDLERKLNWTQERIRELASEKGVLWLDSMLSLCKKETDDLKKQLYSVRIHKASLEEQLRNSQQDMVRWRFESLKSRCILLDREQLLTENYIKFKPVHAIEFHITEKQQNDARPRIVSTRRSLTLENIQRRSLPSVKGVKDQNTSCSQRDNWEECIPKQLTSAIEPLRDITTENIGDHKEPIDVFDITKTSGEVRADSQKFKKESSGGDEYTHPANTLKIHTDSQEEDKENSLNNSKFSKLLVNPPSPMRPSHRTTSSPAARSILIKQRDVCSTEACKIVTFSSKEDLIYHLSPTKSPLPTVDLENSLSTTSQTCNANVSTVSTSTSTTSTASTTSNAKNSKAALKEPRTKSNVVVRRIVIGSKHN